MLLELQNPNASSKNALKLVKGLNICCDGNHKTCKYTATVADATALTGINYELYSEPGTAKQVTFASITAGSGTTADLKTAIETAFGTIGHFDGLGVAVTNASGNSTVVIDNSGIKLISLESGTDQAFVASECQDTVNYLSGKVVY